MIPFNRPPVLGNEISNIQLALDSEKLSGDGTFSRKCEEKLEHLVGCKKALLTPSCTAALEMAAILMDLTHGDEVILPSYTFVSTANAFALRGAKCVFVDVSPETMNIDPEQIANAVNEKTKAIVVVHYAGVACDMDAIMAIADDNKLWVVEDAAQAIDSYHNGKALGSIGHFGTFSFHETKNITSGGEGGALLINHEPSVERAEIIREKGTNRKAFFRGNVDKYSWVDIGSSFLPSELQAAYLYAQLEQMNEIQSKRKKIWNGYYDALKPLADNGSIILGTIPQYATNNAHMFYFHCRDLNERTNLLAHLNSEGVGAVFHYVPLHSAKGGEKFGEFVGEDYFTTNRSETLVRLPLFYSMSQGDEKSCIKAVLGFYEN